jgi:hypothetical protein
MAKKTFPTFVPPMMANSVKEPFDSPNWIFEVKLDGYRGIAVFDPDKRQAQSRNYRQLVPRKQRWQHDQTAPCKSAQEPWSQTTAR